MCDSLVARGSRTALGKTLFAKNSDRRGREVQPFVQFPAAYHAPGSRVRCTHIEIDQVAETYRLMGHSPAWCWGFEQGINEYGVAIGNHATASRETPEEADGLIGQDLVRLGLERGRNAREALEIIAMLIEAHGQGGAAFSPSDDPGYQNSFAIADGSSAWVLETTRRGWVAKSVESAVLTNSLSLHTDWQIGSRGIERAAIEQGFAARGERLDFCAAYARPDRARFSDAQSTPFRACLPWRRRARHRGSLRLSTEPRQTERTTGRRSRADGRSPLQRLHARRSDLVDDGESVAELPRVLGRRPWPVWISFATPCTGIFLPIYLDGVIPAALASAHDSKEDSAPESMWSLMREIQERAATDFSRTLPVVRQHWGVLAEEIELRRGETESRVASQFSRGEREGGGNELSMFMSWAIDRTFEAGSEIARAI